jgi:PAS domain S-box-containing protein
MVKWSDQVAFIHEMPFGYSPSLEEGINFYAPEWRETITNCVTDCWEKGISYDRELEIFTVSGKRIWVRTTGEAVRNESGEIVKLQGSFQDINRRKQAEAALRKSEEKWRKLVNTIPDYVALYDRDGNYLFLNHFAEGFSPKDIEGKTYLDFLPDESKPVYEKTFDEALKTGETYYFEYKALGDNYSIREYESFFVPIFEDGQFANMLVIARDITQRKVAENALKESEALLRELNATKDKFFSIIAHDLKNPFNSIIGFSSILAEEAENLESKEIVEYSSIIHKSSKRAMDLLTNLLDWARSQTGRMLFAPEPLELNALVDREIELLKDAASLKNILIRNKIPSELKLVADKLMLGAVMRNLISNAIKFTGSDGQVVVSAQQKTGTLEISVADNGIGIKKELLGKLFHIEENLTTSGTRDERGTGLGLILCKEFVEKHGGKMWVESEEGKGSTFRFSIPIR